MNTSITPKELEEIYCDYDFRYFLIKNIESEQNKVEGYTISQLKEIIKSYKQTKTELQGQFKKNQTQAIKLIENKLILCHRGNSLPEHFRMTRNAGFHILDFFQYGQIWAHFEVWQSIIKGKKEPSQQRNKQQSQLSEPTLGERINKYFGFFQGNCPRRHKQILKDEDFNRLIEWTIYYYKNQFKVPEISEPIKVVNTNKTFVQLAFKYLFKEFHKTSPYPPSLFHFYKSVFSPYSKDKEKNFRAVKNNDEVKKLMQIDY